MTSQISLSSVPADVLADLKSRYGEPQRAYHTWAHIEALLAMFEEVKAKLHDPAAVLYAILFHDAIYDPTRGDNELKSAELVALLGSDILDETTKAKAAALVLATKQHAVPTGLSADDAEDTAIFLDMDLSILGARAEEFDAYERNVRSEYGHVPDAMFCFGRAAILKGFMARDRLFFSEWGHDRFEVNARNNLKRSLEALEKMS